MDFEQFFNELLNSTTPLTRSSIIKELNKQSESGMELKHKKESYFVIEYRDLERYLEEVWNKKPVQILESPNDTTYRLDRITKGDKYYEEKEYQEIADKGYFVWYDLRTVLLGLCREEKIPEGNYLIIVSW